MITMERETTSSGPHPDHRHRAHEDAPRRSGAASGGLGFDWAMTILSGSFLGGAFLDGSAHTHGRVDDTFFTPWHGVLYSGFLATALFLIGTLIRNVVRGYRWRQALPDGYGLCLAGVALWAAGGPIDLVWHEMFGFEVDVEALISPAHSILALGFVLIGAGPLRAVLRRPETASLGWTQHVPMLLSLTFVLSLITFFAQIAHPVANLWARGAAPSLVDLADAAQELGIVSMFLIAAVLTGSILLVLRHRTLLPGSMTLVLSLNALAMGFLYDAGPYPLAQVLAQSAAGIVADVLLVLLRPHPGRPAAWRAFAFTVPAALQLFYFVSLLLTDGIWWSAHLWLGSIVLCGFVGWLVSYLVMPPPNWEVAREHL